MSSIPERRSIADTTWLWGIVALAWGLTLVAVLTGRTALLDHDALLGSGTLPGPLALLFFLAAWQVMTAAMMLPSSLPMMRRFAQVSQGQEHPTLAFGAFLLAYFAVWTTFALAALVVDGGLHALVNRWAWLAAHPRVISGGLLVLAGLFQFSPLKEQCLQECRTPQGFLWRYYRRGVLAAGSLGVRHGLFCLGCCWALMLVMFGVGVGSLVWLTVLTGVMVLEKTTRWGHTLTPYVGVALILLGLLVLGGPGGSIPFLSGAAYG